jgi:archaellin
MGYDYVKPLLGLAALLTLVVMVGAIWHTNSWNPDPGAIVSGLSNSQSAMKLTSATAYQDPNNSSQIFAIVLIVCPSGTGNIDFNCDNLVISYMNNVVNYANVYGEPNFVNATTFANSYKDNFSSYIAGMGTNKTAIVEVAGNGNQMLEQGETFAVVLNLQNIDSANGPLPTNASFTVELVPNQGAKLTFSGAIPDDLTPIMNLTYS